jgi:hypothetical protein
VAVCAAGPVSLETEGCPALFGAEDGLVGDTELAPAHAAATAANRTAKVLLNKRFAVSIFLSDPPFLSRSCVECAASGDKKR